ncbi:FAD-binding oxidoreductase [Streptomyces deccanensis]|uniref:FAD-binding oxidoreductase n=1 Tax=Streptomyces deccanensis TaxID=424188 RepID=UPI001EFB4AE7|nr:FAD-binding oxidoreductase [Streptomyces deccanensis]ULR48897.1 FAD-binding oxidoreductase [Streptomyces deccanensis]
MTNDDTAPVHGHLLPPDVSAEDFSRALKSLALIVGEEHVLSSPDDLAEFRDPYSFDGRDTFVPSAVVFPGTVEEVQAVVRVANELRIPLWTVSQGRNNGYGGAAPRVGGSVVVSLRRMNRVLEVNDELGYAVVEPGVRFSDLYEHLRAGGHRLMVSTPDLGWGSVIGNALDHGVGYGVYGDHAAGACGMEVVLPDGDLLRTGQGAMTDSKAWHVHRRAFGPSVSDLFMQSNFGIVTKMGVWLLPTPECTLVGTAGVPREEDLEPFVEILRQLMLDRIIDGVPTVASALSVAWLIAPRSNWYQGEGPVPDHVVDEIGRNLGTGRWTVRFSLYGPRSVVDAKFAVIKQAFARIDGADVTGTTYPGDAGADVVAPPHQVPAGIPNLDMLESVKWWGSQGGHVGFSPVLPLIGSVVREQRERARRVVEKYGFDQIGGLLLTPRSAQDVTMFLYDLTNQEQVTAAYAACRELIVETAKAGFGEYRAHLDVMDLVTDQYDFNDHAMRRFTEKLKDAIDPAGILAPGKQGIWPAAHRPAR